MHITIFEEIVRKLGGQEVVGEPIRSQTDLALAILNQLPLSALRGLARAGLSEVEMFVSHDKPAVIGPRKVNL